MMKAKTMTIVMAATVVGGTALSYYLNGWKGTPQIFGVMAFMCGMTALQYWNDERRANREAEKEKSRVEKIDAALAAMDAAMASRKAVRGSHSVDSDWLNPIVFANYKGPNDEEYLVKSWTLYKYIHIYQNIENTGSMK